MERPPKHAGNCFCLPGGVLSALGGGGLASRPHKCAVGTRTGVSLLALVLPTGTRDHVWLDATPRSEERFAESGRSVGRKRIAPRIPVDPGSFQRLFGGRNHLGSPD